MADQKAAGSSTEKGFRVEKLPGSVDRIKITRTDVNADGVLNDQDRSRVDWLEGRLRGICEMVAAHMGLCVVEQV